MYFREEKTKNMTANILASYIIGKHTFIQKVRLLKHLYYNVRL